MYPFAHAATGMFCAAMRYVCDLPNADQQVLVTLAIATCKVQSKVTEALAVILYCNVKLFTVDECAGMTWVACQTVALVIKWE